MRYPNPWFKAELSNSAKLVVEGFLPEHLFIRLDGMPEWVQFTEFENQPFASQKVIFYDPEDDSPILMFRDNSPALDLAQCRVTITAGTSERVITGFVPRGMVERFYADSQLGGDDSSIVSYFDFCLEAPIGADGGQSNGMSVLEESFPFADMNVMICLEEIISQ